MPRVSECSRHHAPLHGAAALPGVGEDGFSLYLPTPDPFSPIAPSVLLSCAFSTNDIPEPRQLMET
jgi:hypothetical protein